MSIRSAVAHRVRQPRFGVHTPFFRNDKGADRQARIAVLARRSIGTFTLAAPGAASAAPQPSLADPVGAVALLDAVDWLEGTLLGTLATTVAIIAVAWLGLLLLDGRIDWRRGVVTIMGCFILFGAKTIAIGLQSLAVGSFPSAPIYTAPIPQPVIPAPVAHPSPTRLEVTL